MAAHVATADTRHIEDAQAGGTQPEAEIHILEPDGPEALIESGQGVPGIAPECEERTGGLVYLHWYRCAESLPVAAIYRIAWPESIEAQHFKRENGGRGEGPHIESILGPALRVEELSRGGSYPGLSEG